MQKLINIKSSLLLSVEPSKIFSMNKYIIKLNSKLCIGCRGCEVSCRIYHSLFFGPKLGLLVSVGPELIDGVMQVIFGFRLCYHCEEPWCLKVCPTGAISKEKDNGLVLLNTKFCVGCKACIDACPWRVPQWDERNRKVVKCDYCNERIIQGLEPACVTVCPTNALSFKKNANQVISQVRMLYAKAILVYPERSKEKRLL